ncbi:MAG: ATP-binding cassette domain-containing protein [Gammaproteobacteria bacterium]|nr:ATP-binding cassette domain-containing protein [Gammaproteobacteria bacterium]MCH9716998.1 ATP-binding cassette domain-containing protein [Gammaproteobacteria bacterium]MCH9763692.1 ATP-binding cassette domain-containing protein [Gammaproteobacteria bacterium]
MTEPILAVRGLQNHLGDQWVHTDVNFSVYPGEIFALIGGSGSGKTTALRSILTLLKPTAGSIQVFGDEINQLNEHEIQHLCQRWGVLFQHSALFSGMTVLENIMFPMQSLTQLDPDLMAQLARLKLLLVGLPLHAASKLPSELSGGMQRRAAAARAISMDPELLFLDEPTSGLDPLSAKQFDHLILFLRRALNLTIIIVSHDIDSLKRTTDRVAFIGDGKILAIDPMDKLMKNKHPLIVDYFSKV